MLIQLGVRLSLWDETMNCLFADLMS